MKPPHVPYDGYVQVAVEDCAATNFPSDVKVFVVVGGRGCYVEPDTADRIAKALTDAAAEVRSVRAG